MRTSRMLSSRETCPRSPKPSRTLDCGGTTPLLLHALLAPHALEFTPAPALPAVQEKRGHGLAVQSISNCSFTVRMARHKRHIPRRAGMNRNGRARRTVNEQDPLTPESLPSETDTRLEGLSPGAIGAGGTRQERPTTAEQKQVETVLCVSSVEPQQDESSEPVAKAPARPVLSRPASLDASPSHPAPSRPGAPQPALCHPSAWHVRETG